MRYSYNKKNQSIQQSWFYFFMMDLIASKNFWAGFLTFLWLVYMAYQLSLMSQGAGNIFLILLGVLFPLAYGAYKYEQRSRKIQTHSYAFVRAMEIIEKFKPSYMYPYEEPYQMELYRELREKLPGISVELEKEFGSSRADIAVDKTIGIEVKGPTRVKDLQTIADKCLRYSEHFDYVIVVLFNTHMKKRMYDEWFRNIRKHYPAIPIVRIEKVRKTPSNYFKEWCQSQNARRKEQAKQVDPWTSHER